MDRSNDIKLPAGTVWLDDPDAQKVCRAIEVEGGLVYFVGGCVRDALLQISGSDVDLCTDVVPTDVTRLAQAAGLKVVPTGVEHGTVTVVSGSKGFEVTTFRRDVETDGRRAVVSFSKDMSQDARRRDFTMNALYATSEGIVLDPLGGIDDCLNRRVRFIDDAASRIREDYLRILRYFRFHAWYARQDDGFDAEALDAISQNTDGLETLSPERIGMEMRKLLSAPDPAPAVAVMRQTGCLQRILPGCDDRFLGPVIHLEQTTGAPPDPLLRLAALGGDAVVDRLRLSRPEARTLQTLGDIAFGAASLPALAYLNGADLARGAAILRSAFAGQPVVEADLEAIDAASKQKFPITARDLMPSYEGKALGDRLKILKDRWIASGFILSREELLTKP